MVSVQMCLLPLAGRARVEVTMRLAMKSADCPTRVFAAVGTGVLHGVCIESLHQHCVPLVILFDWLMPGVLACKVAMMI